MKATMTAVVLDLLAVDCAGDGEIGGDHAPTLAFNVVGTTTAG